MAGLIIKARTPDKKEENIEENQEDSAKSIEDHAQDLIKAIEMKDSKAVAEALTAAFRKLDEEPHVEGEHIEPHSYDAQNKKAAE